MVYWYKESSHGDPSWLPGSKVCHCHWGGFGNLCGLKTIDGHTSHTWFRVGPGSKKERGTERKRKKKKESKARLYCMNEGPRVRKLRKNQEFHIYRALIINAYVKDTRTKRQKEGCLDLMGWEMNTGNGVAWGRLASGLWKPLKEKLPTWKGPD